MNKQEFLDKFVEKLNAISDSDGIKRFLQANPYDEFDNYGFDDLVNEELFINFLYFESDAAKTLREKLSFFLKKNDDAKNTMFILGYQGCGKTTFINSLLNYYHSHDGSSISKLKIDCDKYGVSSEKNPLRNIFHKSLISLIQSHTTSFENFISFFNTNVDILMELPNYSKIYEFWIYVSDFIKNGKSIKNIVDRNDYSLWLEKNCEFKDLFYLFAIFALSNNFHESESDIPIVIFIDNLDNVDEHTQLKLFINAIDDFNVDMNRIFHYLCIYKNSNKKYRYANKIKLVIAMRETTRASFPPSHFADVFRALYIYYDITELYDKDNIVKKRLDFLLSKSLRLNVERRTESEIISYIMSDIKTKDVIIPLFNNNYRKAVSAITNVVCKYTKYFDDYKNIMRSKNRNSRYGARGILLKLIIDEFNNEGYFRQIGAVDFRDMKSNNISIARIMLSYLSNYTDTGCCNDLKNHHPLFRLIEDLNISEEHNIFKPEKIMQFIENMYSLKDTTWTHLISFNHLDYINISSRREINRGISTLHYSCAGKIFLETISTHFEFFSSRIFRQKYPPLFCKENIIQDSSNNEYNFVNLIDGVFKGVEKCCESLKTFNKTVCLYKKHPDPYKTNNIESYRDSHYVAQIKKSDKTMPQFHEERIIDSHIGYIDIFRLFILNDPDISISEKIIINKKLCKFLKMYVSLLDSDTVLISNPLLLIRYKKQLGLIEKSLDDFSIKVNKEKDI